MGCDHKMPESLRAFWRMVSFTAAKTSRMFEVSVACVRLERESAAMPLREFRYDLTEGRDLDALGLLG